MAGKTDEISVQAGEKFCSRYVGTGAGWCNTCHLAAGCATRRLKDWKVLPCPNHGGRHAYHDNRWIATADAVVEKSPYVPNDWCLSQGALICEMRDGPSLHARLVAKAPAMLEKLQYIDKVLDMTQAGDESVMKKGGFVIARAQIKKLLKEILREEA